MSAHPTLHFTSKEAKAQSTNQIKQLATHDPYTFSLIYTDLFSLRTYCDFSDLMTGLIVYHVHYPLGAVYQEPNLCSLCIFSTGPIPDSVCAT